MSALDTTSPLRQVAVPAAMERPVVRGDLPHLGWVEISKLRIDDRYQRPLQRHNWEAIGRIARAFDWSLFTVIDVAPVGGERFSIIDGQHRVHAALMVGIDKVPVRIVNQPLEGQARAFMGINGNVTAISTFHVLRASLAAREPWAVEADRVITRAGCRLMTSNRASAERQPGEVYAVQWVRDRIERDGGVSAPALAAMEVALASLKASQEGAAVTDLWNHIALRGWYGAVEPLDDWIAAPGAALALAGFLDREGLTGMLSRAEDRYRQAKRDGKPSAPVYRLLMADLQDRLDEAFQTKAAFIKAGEAD
ncbi:ParB N-terminal domain-containing protein [uncultured Hoeflea sp.]|uniref:ParB N-terminal domain-containing protein n=1 Tax=uncultured Hoeflea sp. TaxID=538666 RepID=UPI0030D78667